MLGEVLRDDIVVTYLWCKQWYRMVKVAFCIKINTKFSNRIGNSTARLTCIIIKLVASTQARPSPRSNATTILAVSWLLLGELISSQHCQRINRIHSKKTRKVCCLQTHQPNRPAPPSRIQSWSWWIESKQISNSNQRAQHALSTRRTETKTEREREGEKTQPEDTRVAL